MKKDNRIGGWNGIQSVPKKVGLRFFNRVEGINTGDALTAVVKSKLNCF
jgi:hypothetical protein